MNYTLRLVNGCNKQRGIKPLYVKHPFVTKKKYFGIFLLPNFLMDIDVFDGKECYSGKSYVLKEKKKDSLTYDESSCYCQNC